MYDPWENLLETAKKVHLDNSKLQDFCPFPNDIKKQTLKPFHILQVTYCKMKQAC